MSDPGIRHSFAGLSRGNEAQRDEPWRCEVQTFIPYSDFEKTARVLDVKRLGKQRVEVIQVVRAVTVPGYGWASHPAALMWHGYLEALGRYGLTMCEVWTERGFSDSCAATISSDLAAVGVTEIRSYSRLAAEEALPDWLFDSDLQRSHQSALASRPSANEAPARFVSTTRFPRSDLHPREESRR